MAHVIPTASVKFQFSGILRLLVSQRGQYCTNCKSLEALIPSLLFIVVVAPTRRLVVVAVIRVASVATESRYMFGLYLLLPFCTSAT